METLLGVRHLTKKGDYMFSLDLQDGFYALGIAEADRDYFTVDARPSTRMKYGVASRSPPLTAEPSADSRALAFVLPAGGVAAAVGNGPPAPVSEDDVMGVGEDPVGEDGMDIDAPAWSPADVEAADEGVIRKGDPGDFYMNVIAKKFRGVWHYGVITGVVTEWVLEDYGGATQWRDVFEDGSGKVTVQSGWVMEDCLHHMETFSILNAGPLFEEARVKAIMTEKELASPNGRGGLETQRGAKARRPGQRGAKARRPRQRGAKARRPGQRGANARRPGQRGANASGMGGAAVATE
eukprot:jgi/Tetstr1/458018/TSEL_044527.t1